MMILSGQKESLPWPTPLLSLILSLALMLMGVGEAIFKNRKKVHPINLKVRNFGLYLEIVP
jgi:hypothetical protein